MAPQLQARVSNDAPRGVASYESREATQQDTFQSMPRPLASNGYNIENADVPQHRFMGSAGEEGRTSNGSLNTSPGGRTGRERDMSRDLPIRERSRTNAGAGSKPSTQRTCKKCGELLTGQFVRALGGTFHLECFQCQDCGQVVASKFFPVGEEKDPEGQYPLCETDYFRRLGLICHDCGGALRGAYITAMDRKYHVEHFTCSVCPTAFGAKDSYYEHEGNVYCHYHYSTRFAQRCNGCQTAILKQFVEIFRNGMMQHWHPECYMIHKFWNVRLASSSSDVTEKPLSEDNATEEQRTRIRSEEETMEERVFRIWSVLSSFEESSAACISDMLLHVSNGAYVDGVLVAKKFIWHVDILFRATDKLDQAIITQGMKGLAYGREAKLLCKKIVAFFSLLSKTQETGVRRLGVTQELLSLVTGLAHYLKLLIRITLQGALKLEREQHNTDGLNNFLEELGHLDILREAENSLDYTAGASGLADERSDLCSTCNEPVDSDCLRYGERRWHRKHIQCSFCRKDLDDSADLANATWSEREQRAWCPRCVADRRQVSIGGTGFEYITRLQQYVFLLRVALARLLSVLRSGGTLPHTSDDPNLVTYDSNEGHRVIPDGQSDAPLLKARSKSYAAGSTANDQPESSYEQTVGEMKRLRSTRMDKHLSTTIKKARQSRIIDGPMGQSIRPGSAGADGSDQRNQAFRIIEDQDFNGEPRTDITFGNQDALTLDDIPRIVAAEQAKEQRPNAYKHARNQLISGGRQPRLLDGYQRDVAGEKDVDPAAAAGLRQTQRNKRYFSELSALEYFIVRHIAVLSMEPLLEGHYNLEDLLGLIESRKPTFWGKFGRAFKNDKARVGKKKGVFGVNLDVLVEKDGVESTYGVGPGGLRVPSIMDDCISAMRRMDMSVEGVFRKNGNIRGLKEIADRIDLKEDEVDLSKESPVQVAALLKKFLRELPDPLLTHKLHRLFITAQKIADEGKRRRVLHLTCCLLPKSHRDATEILFSFLNWASSFSQVDEDIGSKMDTHNLATVVAPNILISDHKDAAMDESFLAIEAVNSLIEYNDQMCEVPEDIQSILNDTSLFQNNSDITTKEILRRYGDMVKSPGAQHTTVITEQNESTASRSRESNGNMRSGTPVLTQVDADPHQATAWQKESSVRHVLGNGGPTYPSASNHNTPPPNNFEFTNPNSSYHQRGGSNESAASQAAPTKQSYRHSGWNKNGTPAPKGDNGTG